MRIKQVAAERVAYERESFWRLNRRATTIQHETFPDGSDARVYEEFGRFFLVAFAGKSGKPSLNYSYRTEAEACHRAAQFIEGRAQHALRVKDRARARVEYKTTLQPGTILRNSWGYDQTNIDYYQIIAVSPSGKSVTIRKIAARAVADGFMQGTCWPIADDFIGAPMVKRIGEGDAVKIHDWGSWAHPWTPKLDRWTNYA